MNTMTQSKSAANLLLCLSSLFLIPACSTLPGPTRIAPPVPAQWHAPLPPINTDSKQTDLRQWWQNQNDPLLLRLIEAAQSVSPGIAQAWTRIQNARLTLAAAESARLPNLDASLSATRSRALANIPAETTRSLNLQTAWEADLFGANKASDLSAQQQLAGNQAIWHEARTSVAAEVANLYFEARSCQQLLKLAESETRSWQASSQITSRSAAQGLSAPASVALLEASAAQANSRALQQANQCQLQIKAMVALTAIAEPELTQLLAQHDNQRTNQRANQSEPAQPLALTVLPAQLLQQRPDVFAAARNLDAASLEISVAKAKRYPSLSLNGSIGLLRHGNTGASMQTWSIGPLTLAYPLVDGGQRLANIALAEANYAEADSTYRSKVRIAIKEVEEALLNLHDAQLRQQDANIVSQSYASTLAGTQAKLNQGMASKMELEEVRRQALSAQNSQLTLQLEHKRAWVALYRALGGGWTESSNVAATAPEAKRASSH